MTDTDSTKAGRRLREAAAKIRKHAGDATPGPWSPDASIPYGHRVGTTDEAGWVAHTGQHGEDRSQADAEWIALMYPGVGEALAAWLELEADVIAARAAQPEGAEWAVDTGGDHALAVADAILGPAS